MRRLQNLHIGANAHSNIVAEWTALAYAIMDILWTVEGQPDKTFDIEIRQDCYEVLDVIVNGRNYTANVVLINKVKKLWNEAVKTKNIRNMDIYHIYAHGKARNIHPWNDMANLVAKKAVDGFITTKCGPFLIDNSDDDNVEEKKDSKEMA